MIAFPDDNLCALHKVFNFMRDDQSLMYTLCIISPIRILLVLASLPFVACAQNEQSPLLLRIADHGIFPNTDEDIGPPLRKLIDDVTKTSTPVVILFDTGTYRIAASAGNCVPLSGKSDLTIKGAGDSTLLLVTTPDATCFQIENSKGVFISDLRVDYDPLPFTQGTVAAVNSTEGWIEVEINRDYPTPSDTQFLDAVSPFGTWGMVFDRSARRLKRGAPDAIFHRKWEHASGQRWRYFVVSEHALFLNSISVGDGYVHLARSGGAVAHFFKTTNCGVVNLTVHSSPGTAVTGIATDGLKVDGLRVRFPDNTDRLLTTDADGVHFQQGRSGPEIVNCFIEGSADDSINIYYNPNTITKVLNSTSIEVRGGGIVEIGDLLQIFDPVQGTVRGEARVTGLSQLGDTDQILFLDCEVLGIVPGDVQGQVATEGNRSGDTIYNLTRSGRGFSIRNNYFRSHRRHGMMIKGASGIIESNRIEDVGGYGIVIGNDPIWPEGICPTDVVVRNNEIRRCAFGSSWYSASPTAAAIQILTLSKNGLAEQRIVSFLTLQHNTIEDPPGAAVYIGSARDISLTSNKVIYSEGFSLPRSASSIAIQNSEGISINDLSIWAGSVTPRAAVEIQADTAQGALGVTVSNIDIRSSSQFPETIDLR